MARTAEVKRDARIGEAEARRDAQIREAIAEEQRMAARFLNDTEIAKAQRDFELKKAAYDVEVQTKVKRFLMLFAIYIRWTVSYEDITCRKLRQKWLSNYKRRRPSRELWRSKCK